MIPRETGQATYFCFCHNLTRVVIFLTLSWKEVSKLLEKKIEKQKRTPRVIRDLNGSVSAENTTLSPKGNLDFSKQLSLFIACNACMASQVALGPDPDDGDMSHSPTSM